MTPTPKQRMTVEELAQMIAAYTNKAVFTDEGTTHVNHSKLWEQITDAIKQAHAEGYAKGCADTIHNSPMYEAGFSDAIKDAVKVAATHCRRHRDDDEDDLAFCGLPDEIRALRPKEK